MVRAGAETNELQHLTSLRGALLWGYACQPQRHLEPVAGCRPAAHYSSDSSASMDYLKHPPIRTPVEPVAVNV